MVTSSVSVSSLFLGGGGLGDGGTDHWDSKLTTVDSGGLTVEVGVSD